MYNSEVEERLMVALGEYWQSNPSNKLIFEWKDETVIEAVILTFYETDNGYEMEEEGYEEYNACALKFTRIINLPNSRRNSISDVKNDDITVGSNMELSHCNPPARVTTPNGIIIFEL